MTDQATSAKSIISRALSRTRLTVAATMVVERGWPLLLPLLVVISVFLSLSWLGVFRMLPDLPHVRPAPYFARAGWVAVGPEAAISQEDLAGYLREAHRLVAGKLTRKVRAELGL